MNFNVKQLEMLMEAITGANKLVAADTPTPNPSKTAQQHYDLFNLIGQ